MFSTIFLNQLQTLHFYLNRNVKETCSKRETGSKQETRKETLGKQEQ